MTIKDLLEDLLTEFDELDMQPMIIVPNPRERAEAWKHELTYALKHLKAEIAREIFEEIVKTVFSKIPNEIMFINKERDFSDGVILGKREAFFDMINNLTELKKKYIGEQKGGA